MSDNGWSHLSRRDKRRILAALGGSAPPGGPFHVELQPSDRCNVDCFFCSTRWFRRDAELPFDTIRRLADQMDRLGTRSVSLTGGGEPLAHPRAADILDLFRERGLPVANLTTNGIRLEGAVARAVAASCDQVTVSLNAADEETWAEMMGSNRPTFRRVVANVERLLALRRSSAPQVVVQFLVYKNNFRTIPAMYRLARSLAVDHILFGGLSYLPPELRMDDAETEEMMQLFEEVLLEDELRRVRSIHSFEQDVSLGVREIAVRIGERRARKSAPRRLAEMLARRDQDLGAKLRHRRRMKRWHRTLQDLEAHPDPCILPWYSMTVRADGSVPVCCVLQSSGVADVQRQDLDEIWRGAAFGRIREQLRRILAEGAAWGHDPVRDPDIQPSCSPTATCAPCPFRSYYYAQDHRFFARLRALQSGC